MNIRDLITPSELRQVFSSLIDASINGDVKAAGVLLSYVVPKPKPISRSTPYKSVDDVRDAYMLGIISSEEVVSSLTALNLLTDVSLDAEVSNWSPEMLQYISKIAGEK